MNKTAIKNFAIWARNKLIADICYRAGLMGITEKGIADPLPQSTLDAQFYDIGAAEPYLVAGEAIKQRRQLVSTIREKEADTDYATAYQYIMEEVAYTWFNRLIAVRFMEVNDYLPSHLRVLSSESGKVEPDLVTTPFDAELPFTAEEEAQIIQWKQDNKLDELFRFLFIKQCNALNEILPGLFEKTTDYTEVLLNLSVVDQEGVVYKLTHDIAESDFNIEQGGQVEIIGWLYQYYNTEPKAAAFAKNGKITKEEIPAVTQLFTPDWIVRYMVENSLGRLWVEGHPDSDLRKNWEYYLDEAPQEPEVQAKLADIRKEYAALSPEDLTLIDPCMGSGHILVYAFDVLMQIYTSVGYSERDAAKSILEHNLYGLDIDDRAYQLAYFAVMIKARQYNRRILNGENTCHVHAIQESNPINRAHLKFFGAGLSDLEKNTAKMQLEGLLDILTDAKEYGSILNVPEYNWALLRRFVDGIDDEVQISLESAGVEHTAEELQKLIDLGETMARKYWVTCTNPPYAGTSNLSANVNNFVKKNYPDSKADLFAVFIERCRAMTADNGYQAMITQHSWMFLSSFEKLREKMMLTETVNMAHLGARAFEEIGGEVVQTTAFVRCANHVEGYKGTYCRLIEPTSQQGKEEMFLAGQNRYTANQDDFAKIPGAPVAYWISRNLANCYNHALLSSIAFSDGQILTGNNEKYLRLLWEVKMEDILNKKWALHAKGGEFRRWYGNIDTVVRFDAEAISHYKRDKIARFPKDEILFRRGITWTLVSMNPLFGVRELEDDLTFNKAAATILFNKSDAISYVLGFLNSKVAQELLRVINPTMNNNIKDILNMPYIESDRIGEVNDLVESCIRISKEDWDAFETSWDFKRHPLVRGKGTIENAFYEWKQECDNRFAELKSNEEALNKVFIDVYGLQNELTSNIEDRAVTVHKANIQREIRSLLSYAVGCMLGRYSLDIEGLAYAGGEWDSSKYETFIPDADNVIPITDEEYLDNDIVARLCDWLKVVYGADTLEENLDYIARALGNKGNTSREIIRNYFVNGFFKDHCKTYQKRPVYWQFDSGKENAFKALVYMHRWNENTEGVVNADYLLRIQYVYENESARMQDMIDNSKNSREVGNSSKRKEKLMRQLKECRDYYGNLSHLALEQIDIDPNDGVKFNYNKVQLSKTQANLSVLTRL